MSRYSLFLIAFLLLVGCVQQSQRADQPHDDEATLGYEVAMGFLSEVHQDFFNNLQSLCNGTFEGEQVYRSHHGASWAAYELIMYVKDCEGERIAIPFSVGDDHSRTWLFINEDGRLRFRHDHRHEDGTPEEETLYGGYADDRGTAFVQYFPADDYTAELIAGGGGNVWTVAIGEDFSSFSYILERDGEKRFRIDFDLKRSQNE